MDSRYNYCGAFYLMQNQEIFMRKLYDLLFGITQWFRELVYCFMKTFFRQCLDNLKQPVFYSIKY